MKFCIYTTKKKCLSLRLYDLIYFRSLSLVYYFEQESYHESAKNLNEFCIPDQIHNLTVLLQLT